MTQPEDAQLEELLGFMRDSRGFDFTGYKRSTLGRRLRKRIERDDADIKVFLVI